MMRILLFIPEVLILNRLSLTTWGRNGFDVGRKAQGACRGALPRKKEQTCNWQRLRTCSLISRTLYHNVMAVVDRASLSHHGCRTVSPSAAIKKCGGGAFESLSLDVRESP